MTTTDAKATAASTDRGDMPSDVGGRLSLFDRFATRANAFVSRAVFFALCVVLVLVWLPSYFVFGSVDTWQLIINTVTTIVTFLLVALLQNTQTRNDQATQDKLNAVAAALADVITLVDHGADAQRLRRELREAVGLEDRTSS
ncbi:low affinity iron permease family protein [Streptacidiphilus monticola]|jgi:low affinity Fe/Cu permease|uniref:Low affinity iron permease family protein n=1 Tax=Streptacidiphilus monticola TaxID=2161674 RepID=A0ABW1FXL8_9ACTN